MDPRIILMNRVSSFRRKVRGIRSFSSIFLFSLSADYIYFQEIFQFSVRCVQDTLFFVFFFNRFSLMKRLIMFNNTFNKCSEIKRSILGLD